MILSSEFKVFFIFLFFIFFTFSLKEDFLSSQDWKWRSHSLSLCTQSWIALTSFEMGCIDFPESKRTSSIIFTSRIWEKPCGIFLLTGDKNYTMVLKKDISNFKVVFAPTYCLLLFSFSINLVHFKGTSFNCYLLHRLHYLKFHYLLYNIDEMTGEINGASRRKMSNYQFQAADSFVSLENEYSILKLER